MVGLDRIRTVGILAGQIDDHHQGLLCRADPMCRRTFQVMRNETCARAALARNAHEINDHGYLHVERPLAATNFSQQGGIRKARTRK